MSRPSARLGFWSARLPSIDFIQFSVARHNLRHEHPEGLEQFVQMHPATAITAAGVLGSTPFLGLASAFISPVSSGGDWEKAIRV